MSEELMTSAADLTTMIGLRAENDGLRLRLRQAEADAAACYRILEVLTRVGDAESARGVAAAAIARLHPGAALLAELDAARAVVAASRRDPPGSSIDQLLAAYDAAVKARSE